MQVGRNARPRALRRRGNSAKRLGSDLLPTQNTIYLFTTGIIAAPVRQETPEGLERDMAVSFLSRLATLQHLVPRFDRSTQRRIFIMGFPGAGHHGAGDLGNLNAERDYKALPAHMNTVAGNEALVHH